jgi:nitrite reductase/ring-hydroxylating ferredoxin subunit
MATRRDPQTLIDDIGKIEALDPLVAAVTKRVQNATQSALVKNALSGTWLGHQLHPLLTDITIGAWLSASAVDFAGSDAASDTARRLTALGNIAALPTMASGLADWSDTYGSDQRVGMVHAIGNTVALGLQMASYRARRRGNRGRGAMLSLAGLGVASASGYLGGHLVFARGVGVNHVAFEYRTSDWTDVAAADALEVDKPLRVDAGGVAVVVVKTEAGLFALSNRCVHAGGPLDEGELVDGCLKCPWHASMFRLEDGRATRGPATIAQPVWDVRVEAGRVEVRAAD